MTQLPIGGWLAQGSERVNTRLQQPCCTQEPYLVDRAQKEFGVSEYRGPQVDHEKRSRLRFKEFQTDSSGAILIFLSKSSILFAELMHAKCFVQARSVYLPRIQHFLDWGPGATNSFRFSSLKPAHFCSRVTRNSCTGSFCGFQVDNWSNFACHATKIVEICHYKEPKISSICLPGSKIGSLVLQWATQFCCRPEKTFR